MVEALCASNADKYLLEFELKTKLDVRKTHEGPHLNLLLNVQIILCSGTCNAFYLIKLKQTLVHWYTPAVRCCWGHLICKVPCSHSGDASNSQLSLAAVDNALACAIGRCVNQWRDFIAISLFGLSAFKQLSSACSRQCDACR